MEGAKFEAWIKKILATENEEISCSVCFDLVSDYVDLELSGQPAPVGFHKVKQHLEQCQACMDEYVILRDLVQAEHEDLEDE